MLWQGLRRASVAALALALAGVACDRREARFEGHWRGVRAEGVSAEMQPAANAFASGLELDIKEDTMTVTTPKEKRSGRYKVVKKGESSVAITTDQDGPGDPHAFTFIDANTMKWAVMEGKTIVFAKQ